ncbi:DUF2490 domain-containing protein [Adhaeribacter sp. BT258]|uniref:DUF2490 domain-containing protein n=1 Tax=Adhaeribacter terrigena TaxID=2793070 RepID=A0ABS1C1L5_9BACT|nr:DUF2490 domain-containing protein [Adhaeribacter terrigena]MBK0402513.1 DUF2490 domain-containing protein [Adhaeribacter terrigena]
MLRWKIKLLVVFCFGMLPFSGLAQQTTNWQLWNDYEVDIPWKKNLFDTEFSYQTIFSQDEKWRSLNATPAYEFAVNKNLDLISELGLSYTNQSDSTDTFEARTMVGTRINFTPIKRIQTRLRFRFERRHMYNFGEENWQVSHRSRLRGEVIIPLNRPHYSDNKMLYTITDFEMFFVHDKDVKERFANRTRARFGIGYRHNYNFRFEAIFTRQRSRNHLEDGFLTSDNIIRLRIKHYLK